MAVPEGSQAPRRRFLSRLGAAVAAFGAGSAVASAQSPAPSAFAPARHPQDEWLTQLPGKHRIIIDAVSPKGAGEAVLYANNMYTTNRSAYSMDDKDLAIVIVMRHYAAPFALNDAAWAKYGELMAKLLDFHDPKTHEAPKVNLYNAAGYGQQLSNLGATIDTVTKKGAVIAICELATRMATSQVARQTGAEPAAVLKEVMGMALPAGRFVSAGVVAVTRAQELGYSLIYAG